MAPSEQIPEIAGKRAGWGRQLEMRGFHFRTKNIRFGEILFDCWQLKKVVLRLVHTVCGRSVGRWELGAGLWAAGSSSGHSGHFGAKALTRKPGLADSRPETQNLTRNLTRTPGGKSAVPECVSGGETQVSRWAVRWPGRA